MASNRLATLAERIRNGTDFQPISSESGLRQLTKLTLWNWFVSIFNPYPAKADCDFAWFDSRNLRRSIFNPYPAKADCDARGCYIYIIRISFSTHIQRKRIATVCEGRLLPLFVWIFNPYPAKADCDRIPDRNGYIRLLIFNPYPAKADCD